MCAFFMRARRYNSINVYKVAPDADKINILSYWLDVRMKVYNQITS